MPEKYFMPQLKKNCFGGKKDPQLLMCYEYMKMKLSACTGGGGITGEFSRLPLPVVFAAQRQKVF